MEQITTEERELYTAIVEYIEKTDEMCGAQLLNEEEVLARKLRNITLAKSLEHMLKDLVKCRKLSENFLDEALADLAYELSAKISWEKLEYRVGRHP
jgi:hypothetical protein